MLELHPKNILLLMVSWLWFCNIQAQNLTNDGAYIKSATGSYWYFAGDDDLKLFSATANRTQFDNAIVDFDGNGSQMLILDAASFLTIDGTLILNDSLLIDGNAASMASLITGTSVTGAKAVVKQYLSSERWHYISPPVSDEQISVYMDIYLKSWNETTGTWTYLYYPVTTPLIAGQGYAAWASNALTGAATISFEGTLNISDVTVPLTYTPGAGDGYHFIGNPFPCAIEWNNSWTKTNVDATIYIYDGTQYLQWNYNATPEENTLPDGIIPSTQGFVVHANNTGASITIPKNERLHEGDMMYKNSDFNMSLKLKVVGNGRYDYMSVYQNIKSSEDFDGEYDAYKLYGHEDAPQIYSILPNEIATLNALPEIKKGTTVDVGFESEVAGLYSIEVVNFSNGNTNLPVYLLDMKETNLVNLSASMRYDFLASPNDDPTRFKLIFGDPNAEAPAQDNDLMAQSIFAVDDEVYVQSDKPIFGEIEIVDMLGRVTMVAGIEGELTKCIKVNAEPGYYLVLLKTDDNSVASKLYLH